MTVVETGTFGACLSSGSGLELRPELNGLSL